MVSPSARALIVIFLLAILQIIFILAYSNLRRPEDADGDNYRVVNESCPTKANRDLSHAEKNHSGFLTNDGLFFPRDSATIVDGVLSGCVCDLKPCLAICPPRSADGKILNATEDHVNYSKISAIYEEEDDVSPKERFHILIWHPCPDGETYAPEPREYPEDEFYLLKNGSIFQPQNNELQFTDFRSYCLDHLYDSPTYHPLICSGPGDVEGAKPFGDLKYISGLIAVPFLIVTIVIYSVLPELRNVHGKTLRCYLSCVIVGYITLAISRLRHQPSANAGTFCLVLGYTTYYSFMASFLWLNVMCFDVLLKFGSCGRFRNSGASSSRAKFLGYSIYALGTAFTFSLICLLMDFFPNIPESMIRPEFMRLGCWFYSIEARVLYVHGPIGVTITCNVMMFVFTAIKLYKHNNDTERNLNRGESRRHNENQHRFNLFLKLFIVMGISWIWEVISLFWKELENVWAFTDMINALQGISIFYFLICTKKIWKLLKLRYYDKQGGLVSTSGVNCSRETSSASAKARAVSSTGTELSFLSSSEGSRTTTCKSLEMVQTVAVDQQPGGT